MFGEEKCDTIPHKTQFMDPINCSVIFPVIVDVCTIVYISIIIYAYWG